MSKHANLPTAPILASPQPAHFAISFHDLPRQHSQRQPLVHYPGKVDGSRLKYVDCFDHSMPRSVDKQLFDARQRRTLLDETTEVRFQYPDQQLDYSRHRVDFDVLQGVRQLNLYKQENTAKRLFRKIKSFVATFQRNLREFWSYLSESV